MTKYILAGGNDRGSDTYGLKLREEVQKDLPKDELVVLSCLFSTPEDERPERAKVWERWFRARFDPNIDYVVATEESFLDQAKSADIIYLHGGITKLLFDSMNKIGVTSEAFTGKIVVGSSAGANYLAKAFWSSSKQFAGHGSGIIDVNIMVHYGARAHEGVIRDDAQWLKEEHEFQDFIGEGEVITHLSEGEFEVFEL